MRLDRRTAIAFLVHDAYDAHRTFFEGLAAVPPRATIESRADGTVAIENPAGPARRALDPASAASALRDALDAAVEDAVRDASRVAIAASGGLDSTAVAAAASLAWRRLGRDPKDLRLYHLRPRGPNEVEHARAVADALGHALVVVDPPPGDPYAQDEPFLASLDFPADGGGASGWLAVCRTMRDDGADVLLTGDGGDEAVGDVTGPERTRLVRTARGIARIALSPMRRAAARKHALEGLPPGLARAARDLNVEEPERTPPPRRGLAGGAAARDRALRSARQTAMVGWLRAMGRLHGLRARVPFLDPRVADLVTSLPVAAFERESAPKALLSRAVAGRVPERLATRGKDQPFYEPLWAEDIRAFGDAWLERFVRGSAIEASGLLGLDDARSILRAASSGDELALPRALALVGLTAWARCRSIGA